ncbi:MMPL family transporter [Planctomycetes bacterium K23_9]|uniref:Membrane transport protein mmpL8 n=1 Tax=Stieleria marina TaxID=1930275 RepID=A0A517P348_9BACT|nr:Membrane transport protein mmpL8 [Planctomycetes bacterium K23_9]
MQRSVSAAWAEIVTRWWHVVLIAWIVIAVGLRLAAPAWNDVAYDGDFEYLPPTMSSVAGGRLLDDAFPGVRSRSQIVLVLGRAEDKLTPNDEIVGLDLLRRLYHRLAEVSWQRAIEFGYESGPVDQAGDAAPWVRLTREALDQSISIDERFYERIAATVPADPPTPEEPRMAIAHWDRGKLLECLGETEEAIGTDFEAALILMPELPTVATPIEQRDLGPWSSMIDVLSWDDKIIGSRMTHESARLAVMQLSSELAATGNIETVEAVNELIDTVRHYSLHYTEPGLKLEMTGSAAIGGETLLAARDAIRYTEWITVAMILLILAGVYRAPLLVAVPMVSIGVAVLVSTSLVALLTGWSINETVPGLDLRVFTTSRIFIVVILFGAGTDYCLFLIARLKEEAAKAEWPEACRNALTGVSSALMGSALTTIVGLGTLWIARFGKFHYTGPIIAICLLVGLLICMTLTPALLRALGPKVFWPATIQPTVSINGLFSRGSDSQTGSSTATIGGGVWSWIALMITRRPMTWLVLGVTVLAIPGTYGLINENSVTYDLSGELSHSAASRRGLRLLSQHFKIGEINPVTVLLVRPDEKPHKEFVKEIGKLSDRLYKADGVATVRTAVDPLGDFPPDRDMGLLSSDAWKRLVLQKHRIAQGYFFASDAKYKDRLARIDVVFAGDPFSIQTAAKVAALSKTLAAESANPNSTWADSKILLTGTTPSIMDLRSVTLSDNRRIKVAVVVAVFLVLVFVIRRVGLCFYLIATVLLSYYATLGLTLLFFQGAYGNEFVGLDWKLPIFLFVILVAVGQDYNVYLVTRILEEQRSFGWLIALRRAVSRTGGIITACGLVMAATFFSMTSSAWFPEVASWFGFTTGGKVGLRGIIELGFALGLGVLIDTFYVRTILVPSFVAIAGRRKKS